MNSLKKISLNFIDLFSGAGGLSEGFIRAGFNPVAHVEIDEAACNTLLTRTVYHKLKNTTGFELYKSYLKGKLSKEKLHGLLNVDEYNSVINLAISDENNPVIFKRIDDLINGKSIDLIVGGPPCQAYSLAGRARDKKKMKGDSRNYLFQQYAKYLEYYKPKIFVFENVLGLLSAMNEDGSKYIDQMISLFSEVGYITEYKLVNASDFGVLQNRKRVILIGKKGKETGFYPEFEKNADNKTALVKEILADLPEIQAGSGDWFNVKYKNKGSEYVFDASIRNGIDFTTQHIARPHNNQDKEIYRIAVKKWNSGQTRLDYNDLPDELKSHSNRHSFVDRFKVVAPDLTKTQTVVAHIAKDGHYYIHPDIFQNRSLTVREAARLQSFPDDYFFEGIDEKPSRTAAFKQIGNAVPPLLAEQIAKKIKQLIKI
ncbi:MAG: hypothetical protein FD181_1760 [Prolixibacteraceae bacterium]|nr:MAG: hypothetical protein FD181_1760 [Prolixibacteraceae bacterium]